MSRQPFNDSWFVEKLVSPFDQRQDKQQVPLEVNLPYDALVHEERNADALGKGKNAYFPSAEYAYTKTFFPDLEHPRSSLVLEFDGVYRSAMVYVNDCLAGQNEYGYSKFFVDMTPFLKLGTSNEIRVECRTHLDSRWYTGAGIYREVTLHSLGPSRFEPGTLRCTPESRADGSYVAHIEAEFRSLDPQVSQKFARLTVTDPRGEQVAKQILPITAFPNESTPFWADVLLVDPTLWTTDTPLLYTAQLEVFDKADASGFVIDTSSVQFGCRTITADKVSGLLLNNEPLKLRGACVHHDNGPLGAASHYDAELRRVTALKQAGFNAVRSSHNPMSDAFLRACDDVGMLVIEEAFDVWTHSKTAHDQSLNFSNTWETDISSMVGRAYNHPSVIGYSIGNEVLEIGNPSGAIWSRRLAHKIKTLDKTRFVTNGLNGFVAVLKDLKALREKQSSSQDQLERTKKSVNEAMNAGDMMNAISASPMVTEKIREASLVLDIVGLNYGDSRYLLPSDESPHPLTMGSETFPPKIGVNWPVIESAAHLVGDFTWSGWDYLGEVGIGRVQWADEVSEFEAPFPWLTATVGDFDISGDRNPISYFREIVFGLRDIPFIATQNPQNFGRTALQGQWAWHDCEPSWTWPGSTGKRSRVEVYSQAEIINLYQDGVVIGSAPCGPEHGYRAVFEVVYQPGELRADAVSGGEVLSSSYLRTVSQTTRLDVALDQSSEHLSAQGLAYYILSAVDSNGARNRSDTSTVRIDSVTGGTLLAVGNGDPCFDGRFDANSIPLFKGRAIAVVSIKDSSTISLNAVFE